MTEEPRRPGRPKKHPAEELHFKPSTGGTGDGSLFSATLEDGIVKETTIQPSAPPATSAIVEPAAEAEAGSPNPASVDVAITQEPAALHAEAVVENPIVPGADILSALEEVNIVEIVSEVFGESPLEEKINELVELNGYNPLPDGDAPHTSLLPPRNGTPVLITDNPQKPGVTAFWKKTRAFANPTKKWQTTGIWCDYLTGVKVPFEPKYWRARNV